MTHYATITDGIDIGKSWLDSACHPSGMALRAPNTPAGHRQLAEWLRRHAVERIGLEASGG